LFSQQVPAQCFILDNTTYCTVSNIIKLTRYFLAHVHGPVGSGPLSVSSSDADVRRSGVAFVQVRQHRHGSLVVVAPELPELNARRRHATATAAKHSSGCCRAKIAAGAY